MRGARVLPVLAAVLLALGGCATTTSTPETAAVQDGPAEAVRAAARTATEAGGARVTLSGRGPARDRQITVTGAGWVDLREHTTSARLEVGDLGAVDARVIGREAYAALPPEAIGDIARGRPWVSVGLDEVDLGLFADTAIQLGAGTTGNPANVAAMAASIADGAVSTGADTVDGTPTTRVRGRVDLGRLAAGRPDLRPLVDRLAAQLGMTQVAVDVWLDEQGRLRQLTQYLGSGTSTAASTTITLADPGPQPAVVAPPAERVQDLLGSLRRQRED